eukprot:TRINITY_DN2977_c0_g1_i4.p1 TRINITY_DN2977_c0_g1~~TRINITY_DN2977_c0_g1_i4.p1  ORF type:complete len:325 (-),score=48.04 TRINITY_DN2977_c0_g1_i4:129-1103(-)
MEATDIHMLTCECIYTKKNVGEKQFVRKYKFTVSNPFTLEFKIAQMMSGYAVQAQITNATARSIYIESVSFETHPSFKCRSISPKSNSNIQIPGVPDLGQMTYLHVMDSCQYLFQFEYLQPSDQLTKTATTLGCLRIVWKSTMGDTGEWVSEPFETKSTVDPKRMAIMIEDLPTSSPIYLEEPFTVKMKLLNRSENPIFPKITIVPETDFGIKSIGNTTELPTEIPPKGSSDVVWSFIPIKLGIQRLCGFSIVDTKTSTQHEFKYMTPILVENRGQVIDGIINTTIDKASPIIVQPIHSTVVTQPTIPIDTTPSDSGETIDLSS